MSDLSGAYHLSPILTVKVHIVNGVLKIIFQNRGVLENFSVMHNFDGSILSTMTKVHVRS